MNTDKLKSKPSKYNTLNDFIYLSPKNSGIETGGYID